MVQIIDLPRQRLTLTSILESCLLNLRAHIRGEVQLTPQQEELVQKAFQVRPYCAE